MELYFPTELPERLAYLGACLLALHGLLQFALPSTALKLFGFTVGEVTPEGYAAIRSNGGLQLGLGLTALFLAQDWTYLALGVSAGVAALGRLISLIFDRGVTARNIVQFLAQIVIAALPLGYVFGYF
ncbi:DUF4345 domain-containing protein [Rhizobium lemnae]|uniref:DUF4345 domain-containing protein n=1 Tax=Rhizobium lemnae TaxID=1214924 RepID=A0ABV8E672_9HYPH|nr:DUF4345 domain-containing protein [Rhizobium lemnae]MCJ8506677.1 DUF4345 domain-containing protein [Rhizobium lemnae]